MRDLLDTGNRDQTGLLGAGLGSLILAAAAGATFVLWQRSAQKAGTGDDGDPGAGEPDDDLTRINGIGPALAAKLRDNGVTSFAQIAAWNADDIAAFDTKLKFAGRIERDDWTGQAKTLQGA